MSAISSGNYQSIFKVLGKLAYMYNMASSIGITTAEAAILSQEVVSLTTWELDKDLGIYDSQLDAVISQGVATGSQQQSLIAKIASTYLTSDAFNGYFGTPPNPINAAAAVTALAAAMTSDSVTCTTSGLIIALLNVINPTPTIPNAVDASATYKDSVYAIAALV